MIDENVENILLHAVESPAEKEKCLLGNDSWQVLYQLSDIRENLLEWYPFDPQASLLEIGAECGVLTDLFCRKVKRVVAVEASARDAKVNLKRNGRYENLTVVTDERYHVDLAEKFDYVTITGLFGYAGRIWDGDDPYMDLLRRAKSYLKPGGRLFLAIENKYGVKYFAGAKEDHTGRCFDGLENYAAADDVRTFAHKTLDQMLTEAGFSQNDFYYPMPDEKLPSEIYSDKSLPSFGSLRYPCVAYDRDRYELLDERLVFDSICQDGMFGEFANSFLVVSRNGVPQTADERTVVYAKYNRQRAPEYQLSTKIILKKDGSRYVEKEALRKEAVSHVMGLSANRDRLLQLKAGPVPVEILSDADGCAVFPFVSGMSLTKEVNESLRNRQRFFNAMHHAVDSIYGSYFNTPECLVDFTFTREFEEIFGTFSEETDREVFKGTKALKVSNIDSILSNFVRMADGSLVCLDYEWVFDFPIPVEYLIYRTVYYYYSENIHYIKMSEQDLWTEFKIAESKIRLFRKMDDQFQQHVHGKDRRYIYTSRYGKQSFNLGKNLQFGEGWFLSIVQDIHKLNGNIGGSKRDLVVCHVKMHRKSEFFEKCKNRLKHTAKRILKK